MSYDLWKTRDPNDTGFYDMPEDDGPTELDIAYQRIDALVKALEPFAKTGWMTSDTEHTDRTVIAHMHPEQQYEIILSSEDFKRAAAVLAEVRKQGAT